jgi:ABC-type multidrug transport system fused ATPase/permease subunit
MKKQNNFIRFLSYVRPYWLYILLGAIGGVVKFTVPLLVPQATRYLLDSVYLNPMLTTSQKLHQLFVLVGGLLAIFVDLCAALFYGQGRSQSRIRPARRSLLSHFADVVVIFSA